MYRSFFGLRERPFDLTPNPRYLYLTGGHREALSNLHYGITGHKGVTVLVGEAGTGKTTIVRAAMDMVGGGGVRCIYMNNPALTRAEFYEFLAPKFGLSERAAASKAVFLGELEETLLERQRANVTTALIVDEAQSLPHELMEEVRLLANMETADDKLLQVVLAGQPELADRLEHEALRQLKQRVALRCELPPLDVHGTAAYISGRVAVAGGQAAQIFTREAVVAIHEWSRGIPRTISVICDNCLVTAFAAEVKPIGVGIVLDVCRDFKLESSPVRRPRDNWPAGEPEGGLPVAGEPRRGDAAPGTQPQLSVRMPAGGPRPDPPAPRAFTPPPAAPPPPRVAVEPPAPAPVRPLGPPSARPGGDEMFSSFSKRKKRFFFF